jgi:hypothetical protein
MSFLSNCSKFWQHLSSWSNYLFYDHLLQVTETGSNHKNFISLSTSTNKILLIPNSTIYIIKKIFQKEVVAFNFSCKFFLIETKKLKMYTRNVLDMDCQTQGRLKLMIELYISEICHKFQ